MSYLLDTCVLSEALRPEPDRGVQEFLDTRDPGELFLSVLTLGELWKGVCKLATGRKRTRLMEWIESELPAEFQGRILAVDSAVAVGWGELQARGESRGLPLPVIDSLLASTALRSSLTVVTRNTRHFAQSGASVLNPWVQAQSSGTS